MRMPNWYKTSQEQKVRYSGNLSFNMWIKSGGDPHRERQQVVSDLVNMSTMAEQLGIDIVIDSVNAEYPLHSKEKKVDDELV